MKELASPQIIFVGPNTLGRHLLDRLLFLIGQNDLQRVDDAGGDLILNGEYVFHLAVVALRPHLEARRDIDELSRNTESVSCLSYASFENRVDLQLSPDRADV